MFAPNSGQQVPRQVPGGIMPSQADNAINCEEDFDNGIPAILLVN